VGKNSRGLKNFWQGNQFWFWIGGAIGSRVREEARSSLKFLLKRTDLCKLVQSDSERASQVYKSIPRFDGLLELEKKAFLIVLNLVTQLSLSITSILSKDSQKLPTIDGSLKTTALCK
jgi:hypothetical protein